ncbi:MAG TPA: sulfatase-like hydrolase/transferase [Acidimicrobiales bacterium]
MVTDAAVLFGLAGVAVTQPLLELFGDNPTFFVAGRYGRGQILAFAVVIAVLPALVAAAASVPFRFVGHRSGAVAHGLAVGVLAGTFGLVVCRTAGVDRTAFAAAAALVLAVAVAVVEARWQPARRFLAYLALGNIAFLVLFLVASPSADLLRDEEPPDLGAVEVPRLDGPVLIVIFDELPLTALLRPGGTINDARYPNFARLAEATTWFRDAASESPETYVSVPTLLSGVRGRDDEVPTFRDYPRNYFTLFGDRYPLNRYSLVTDICPDDLCPKDPGSLRQMLTDASVVYRHRVLPAALRDGLPAIDQSWGRFGNGLGVQAQRTASGEVNMFAGVDRGRIDEMGRPAQAAALVSRVREIGPEPSVNYVHVLLPHTPYVLTPWGGVDADTWVPADVPAAPTPDEQPIYRDVLALQAMQVGALDASLGEMIDHLESSGAWDDALVVVTADHGVDATPPGFGRELADGNQDELLRIPLFVKAPGQTAGEVSDAPASTVDVLPTIVDLLDIETDWHFDGRSLFDGGAAPSERRLTSSFDAALAVADRHAAQFPAGDDWGALASVGAAEGLVGTPVTELDVADPSALRWSIDRRGLLRDLSTDGVVPYLLRGAVDGSDRPVDLVVALNGRIAGAVHGYRRDGGAWLVSGVMGPYFRDGANDVAAYEVEHVGGRVVLHPVAEDRPP